MRKLDDLIKEYCPNGVEYKKLGGVCKLSHGKQISKDYLGNKGKYPVYGGGSCKGYYKDYNTNKNTIIIARVGNAGLVSYIRTKFWATDNSIIVSDIINEC